MRKLFFAAFLLLLATIVSSCQAFLEDYNYAPIGNMSSGESY